MSEIRFNRWSHQSGTGGIYQDSSGNIGIGTSTPTSVLDIQGGSIKIGNDLLTSSGVSTFTSGLNVTSGSVGIGTDNPTTKLVIAGDWVNSTGQLRIKPSSAGQTLSGFTLAGQDNTLLATVYAHSSSNFLAIQTNDASGSIRFSGPSSEHLRITSDGNVGINTDTDVSGKLNISGKSNLSTTYNDWSGDAIFIQSSSASSGQDTYGPGIVWTRHGTTNTRRSAVTSVQTGSDTDQVGLAFFTHPSGTASQPLVEKLRITHAGNIGIGTDNPGTKLDLLNGSDAAVIVQVTGADTSSEYLGLGVNGSDAIITGGGNGSTSTNLILKTADSGTETERLCITSDGKIGINNTNPLYAMHFKNAMSSTPSYIHMEVTGTNAVGGGGGIQFDTSASNDTSNNGLYLAQISGERSSSNDGSNSLVFKTTNAGSLGDDGNANTPKTRMIIDEDGHVTISDGNLIIGTSGHGIDFSATSDGSGTATSELFDDYEEGTFTPTVVPSSGSFTTASYGDRVGIYRKVGNMVYIQIRTNFNSFNRGSASGNVTITGLPYSTFSTAYANYLNVGQCNNWTGGTPPSGAIVGGTTITLMEGIPNSGYNNDFTEVTDMGSTSENRIQLSGWYPTS